MLAIPDVYAREIIRTRTRKAVSQRMIDLHSHILPGIDDGAPDMRTSLEMARAWVADGVTTLACTPHILPGLYPNSGPSIRRAVAELQTGLYEADIPLKLVTGADNHVIFDFVDGLRSGHLLSLNDTRYVLVEPPHHSLPPRLADLLFRITAAGYVPIVTHPERLSWIETHYNLIVALAERGVWMQITAGALTGAFGRGPKYWGERMLCEGRAHILATDAHDMKRRPPALSHGYARASQLVGKAEADRLVYERPRAVLEDQATSIIEQPTPKKVATKEGNRSYEVRSAHPGNLARPRDDSSRGLFKWMQRYLS